jgi:thiol-disulfide isomerase/thioredoxin
MCRFFNYTLILLFFYSCQPVRSVDGKSKPVYFTSDPKIFTDTLYPYQYAFINNPLGFEGRTFQLINGETAKAFIHGPTFITKGGNEFLIYPKEQIMVSGDYDDFTFTTVAGNSRRDKELQFFKNFRRLEKWPTPWNVPDYTVHTILDFEKEQKIAIQKCKIDNQKIFDSLITEYDVSNKFKRLTRNYLQGKYDWALLFLYKTYRDTLQAYGLYKPMLEQLLPAFQNIKKRSQLNYYRREYLNDLRVELFPEGKMWNFDEANFKVCFDTIERYFSGTARAYLLTRLMSRAYSKRMEIPDDYLDKYKNQHIPHAYRSYVKRVKKDRYKYDKEKDEVKDNILLATDGKTQLTFDSLVAQNKGKYILVHLWASWCGPCVAEIPFLQQLEKKYDEKKIMFLNISVDKNEGSWNKAWVQRYDKQGYHYLWTNFIKAFFYNEFKVTTIPRYLLLDTDGKVINPDAPRPSDPALTVLLDKLLAHDSF